MVDARFPGGARFIAPRQPEGHGKAHGTPDVRAGHGIVRQRIGVITMIVMAVYILAQAAHLCA